MEAGWIVPKGRRETVGRPVTWGTSEAFLHHFSLGDIGDLPGMEELKAAGLIGGRAPGALRETALPHEVPRPEDAASEEPAPELEPLLDEEGPDRRGGG
jgi:segregation and condensation protein B